MFNRTLFTLLILALALAACALAAAPVAPTLAPTQTAQPEPTAEVMPTTAELTTATEATPLTTVAPVATATSTAVVATPAWFGAALTDVRTGATFTLNDLRGKVVLVEMLAMWCPKCKTQQGEVKTLHAALGANPDLVTVGLDIDPNENATDLKAYIEHHQFDWLYAVAPREVAREIGVLYGDQFLNPPSTPILIIDRTGQAHPLAFGIKSAADLQTALEPFLQE